MGGTSQPVRLYNTLDCGTLQLKMKLTLFSSKLNLFSIDQNGLSVALLGFEILATIPSNEMQNFKQS